MTLNVIALEVVLNPYDSIDYDSINSYPQNECSCNCSDYQENDFNQVNKYWWE
jgi:hypothetical protein